QQDALKTTEKDQTDLGYLTINGGKYTISAGDDGIQSGKALTLNGGDVTIIRSREGIGSKVIVINNGNLDVTASDDGINAADGTDSRSNSATIDNLRLTINGGTIVVRSSGDGIDSNGNVYQNGGFILVYGPLSGGNTSLDFDGSYACNGGTIAAFAGTTQMAQMPGSTSTQNSIMITFPINKSERSLLHIEDNLTKEIITIRPFKTYRLFTLSSPSLVNGTYNLYLDGVSDKTNVTGNLTGGIYSDGILNTTFTVSGLNTRISAK
ncbi:MAG: carbohydrate-binding domain-containing protein, partial [Leadbetterella sp.]